MRCKKFMHEIGDTIRHTSNNKTGVVLDRWFDGVDNRYLVYYGFNNWSIPEFATSRIKKRSKIKGPKSENSILRAQGEKEMVGDERS